MIRNDHKLGPGPTLEGWCLYQTFPRDSHWDKQFGQAQPVPVEQADWDRLCLSQLDRQAPCFNPVPLALGKVKRDLSLSHGTSHIPTLEAFPCPGTSSILYTHHGACPICTCLVPPACIKGRGIFRTFRCGKTISHDSHHREHIGFLSQNSEQ